MNIQDIKIGDLLTVWDALEGDSVGRIIEIIPVVNIVTVMP